MRTTVIVLIGSFALLATGCGGDGDGGGGSGEADGGTPWIFQNGDGGFVTKGQSQPRTPVVRPPLGQYPQVQTRLPRFDLQLAEEDLAQLDADPTSNATVPAIVTLDGLRAPAQVRYRGASTRTLPQKGFKIELYPGYRLDGRNDFELLAEYLDAGKLSEKFAIDLFIALGLPVPDGEYVTVSVNGKPNGLYLDMLHVGDEYLATNGMEPEALIYRAGGRNGEMKLADPGPYQQDWVRRGTADVGPGPELVELLRFINRTDDPEFEAGLGSRMNLDAYLGNLAADAVISNNIVEDARGFWLLEQLRSRWTYVPWDLNNARLLFYRTWDEADPPIVSRHAMVFTVYDSMVAATWNERNGDPDYRPTWSVLNTRLWDRPALRTRILDQIRFALAGPFSQAQAHAHIDRLWALVRDELYRDPYVSRPHADNAVAFLKSYVTGRRAWLTNALQGLEQHGSGPLVINELGFGPGGYVELFNRGTAPISLQGYAITDDLRSPQLHRLPAGLVVPANGWLRLIADGNASAGADHLPFTLSAEGGELGLFDGVRVWDPFDLVYFGPHPAGTAYGRSPDGTENFATLTPTPGTQNR